MMSTNDISSNKDGLLRAASMLERMDQYSEGLQEFVGRQIAEGSEYLLVMSEY
jgi:hypothetical protein